ncbi:hypothetical protein Taro_003988 [Colocasia esculenta]|uniref:Uncharacterized protein n=1 Tax=Colocasia esculenta TaxID=4460 RepID=A0A843TTL7_COLES|nr:hypothetical protein [Colocasia esculenta]
MSSDLQGIKCLFSELLELKKSSDEDFQKNVCSKYSTFIRQLDETTSPSGVICNPRLKKR